MIVQAIRTILLADQVVSGAVKGRIVTDRYPQDSQTPSIVLWVESERALDALDGPLGMDQPKLRVACYAKTRSAASSLRQQVRRVLGGFIGVRDGYYIKGIAQIEQRGESYETDRVLLGTDEYRYVSVQDFRVSYDFKVIS